MNQTTANSPDNQILSVSLVTYKNEVKKIIDVLESLKKTPIPHKTLIIDNSPTPSLLNEISHFDIEYTHNNGQNFGFGKAHNLAINKSGNTKYHLVINPDVYFESDVIPKLIEYMDKHQDVGLITPKILFPNGEIQYLCKQNPTFFALFARRFIPKPLQYLTKSYMEWYEMRDIGYDKITDVSYLSGCFMLFRKKYLDEIGYFDENIFMYLEDADITLRMAQKYRTIFYPNVHIFHHWAKGSYKSFKLTLINIQSAIYFFNKHGWKIL